MTRMDARKLPWARLIGLSSLLLAVAGCANFWEELLSSERDWRYVYNIKKPDPILVIRDNPDGGMNSDGARRAQAFAELQEPLQHGGNAKDQEAILNILGAAAKTDSQPLCRLTAIRALGRFHDARAARTLEDVYQQQKLPFTPEHNSQIRKEALAALEVTHDPDARHLLIRVARQPGPPHNADLVDRQQTQDEKIVAIRALAKYKEPECVEALKYVLKTEKDDIALRHRALQSLEESTGQKWPAEFVAWQNSDVRPLPPDTSNGFIQTVSGWMPKLP